MRVPLRLEAFAVEGCDVQRSGIRWLCDDGHLCRPGEVIAWCHIGLAPRPGHVAGPLPFAEERHDLQAALAPRAAGRLVKAKAVSRGGFLDLHQHHHQWSPDTVLGHLECDLSALAAEPRQAGTLKTLLLAGRRVAEHAEVRGGPATGWHDRTRAWWGTGGRFGTVLSLGICEQQGVVRGEQGGFFELFEAVPGPAHFVHVPDEVLVPSAAVLLSQLRRTDEERRQLADDLARTLGAAAAGADGPAVAAAWLFAGALLKALLRSPPAERYDLLTPGGLTQAGPADALLLSLHSEHPYVLRHKRLGYALDCHPYRLREGGPVVLHWLQSEFESVRRTAEDVRRDYRALLAALRAGSNPHVLVLNVLAGAWQDDVVSYAPFERPLADSVPQLAARERNLMLSDLARELDLAVVDVDALAVELGVAEHLPDGVHQSGPLQAAARGEIVRILRGRGVAGFGRAAGAGPVRPEHVLAKGNRAAPVKGGVS